MLTLFFLSLEGSIKIHAFINTIPKEHIAGPQHTLLDAIDFVA